GESAEILQADTRDGTIAPTEPELPFLLQSLPMSSAFAPLRESSAAQRRTLLAASLGWALDAFDVMLYALVLAHIMRDLGISKGTAGLLDKLSSAGSAICGVPLRLSV